MSFRGRLRIFFALIVVVPLLVVGLVAFVLAGRSEHGKADAAIASGLGAAFAVQRESSNDAEPALRRAAADETLRAALVERDRDAIRARMRRLVDAPGGPLALALRSPSGELVARAGLPDAVASKAASLNAAGGRDLGTLAASSTGARRLAKRVERLTGLEVALFRRGRRLASTLPGGFGRPPPEGRRDFTIGGADYRGRVDRLREPVGAPVEIVVLRDASAIDGRIADTRRVILAIVAGFLVAALASGAVVGRALTGQVGNFLTAARRIARGDFAHTVPVEGHDEFAQLGHEFNSMSGRLAGKIAEVERKRQELEDTIRRVGDALATGLDRQGVVDLAVRTAVDACEAEVGRALPLDRGAFQASASSAVEGDLATALEAAERRAFEPAPEIGRELLEPVDGDGPMPRQRRAVSAQAGAAHSLAVALRSLFGEQAVAPEYVGVLSIARRDRPFAREEEELLEYLAGQAVVSIENAHLHATVQRQAVTDDLTGLANVRALHAILNREIERSRRFGSPLGLVMADIDHFKRVNDAHGHQQGDEVLAGVASVLRDLSRDIDAPARYGGEEMSVVLPGTDSEGAAQLAERMREAVERLRIPLAGGAGTLQVTASFGVASMPGSASDKAGLIAAADAALYRAKRGGRNRVEQADPVSAPR